MESAHVHVDPVAQLFFFLCLLGSTSLLVIFDRHFEFVQPTCQGAYLLATLMHNWHRPLYTRRGGKRIIKVPQLFYDQKHSFNKNNCHHIQSWLQDWASTQATQTRAVLGHLHTLARKSVSSRHRKGWVDEFFGCPYRDSVLKPANVMQEPENPCSEDTLPSADW